MRPCRILEQGPVQHGALVMVAGPFDVGDRDAPEHAALDRLDHVRMPQRRDVALALQLGLDLVHAARDVHREHQLQIDRNILGGGGQARHGEQSGDQRRPGRNSSEAHGGIRDQAAWDIARPRRARMEPFCIDSSLQAARVQPAPIVIVANSACAAGSRAGGRTVRCRGQLQRAQLAPGHERLASSRQPRAPLRLPTPRGPWPGTRSCGARTRRDRAAARPRRCAPDRAAAPRDRRARRAGPRPRRAPPCA